MLCYSRGHANLTDEPAKPISGNDVAFGILAFSQTAAKGGVIAMPLLFFRSLERRRLRISAETRSRWLMIRCKEQQKQLAVCLPTPPAGFVHLMNASEH
jgi:hypothetical protein